MSKRRSNPTVERKKGAYSGLLIAISSEKQHGLQAAPQRLLRRLGMSSRSLDGDELGSAKKPFKRRQQKIFGSPQQPGKAHANRRLQPVREFSVRAGAKG